ncbi:hypothetical protein pb186bvf_015521 [Paramecium bursaria]
MEFPQYLKKQFNVFSNCQIFLHFQFRIKLQQEQQIQKEVYVEKKPESVPIVDTIKITQMTNIFNINPNSQILQKHNTKCIYFILIKKDSKQKEIEAYASLAKCYIKIGDIDESQKHLDQQHISAKDQKLHNAQSDAALMLAKLHQQKGNTAKSLEYFSSHFDCDKSEKSENKNRKLIDKARVTYAIAKANSYIDNYIKLVAKSDKNLKALLDWKQRKIKENSNLQLYFHFIVQQLNILFFVKIPSSKTIVACSIQILSSKIKYQFIHRKIGNLNLIYLFEFRTFGCININKTALKDLKIRSLNCLGMFHRSLILHLIQNTIILGSLGRAQDNDSSLGQMGIQTCSHSHLAQVVQMKTPEKDEYSALQIGAGDANIKKLKKPKQDIL